MRLSPAAISILFLASAHVRADDLTGRFAAGGALGAGGAGGSTWVRDHNDPGLLLGGFLRYGLIPRLSLGLSYDRLDFEKDAARVQPVLANAWVSLDPESAWNPNLRLAFGASEVSRIEAGNHISTTLKLGAGVDRFVHKGLSAGAFLDYLWAARTSNVTHEVHAFLLGVNLAYWFDLSRWPSRETRGPLRARAAPAPEPAPRPTPAPAPARAQAPATAARRASIDKGEKVSIHLLIEFETAEWDVRPRYDDQLRKVSDFMKTYPGTKAEIEGHTDDVGSKALNMALSERRADAVRRALMNRFAESGDRLSAKGYGLTRPVAGNATAAGRARNRRVMATFSAVKD